MFKNLQTRHKILLGFSVPILLMLLVAIVVYINITEMIQTTGRVNHTNEVMNDARELGKLIVDMETGERGFLITGKKTFLEPFNEAQRVWNKKIMEIEYKVSDNSEQVSRIQVIDNLAKQWLKVAAQPEINAKIESSKTGATMDKVILLVSSKKGKKIIDTIRIKLDEFIQVETGLMKIRNSESKNTASNTIIVTFVGAAIAILTALLSALIVSAKIAGNLGLLVKRTKEISDGNFSGMIRIKNNDEVGELSKSFNQMTVKLKSSTTSIKNLNVVAANLKKSKKELERSNQELSQYAYAVSHDLKAPLRAVHNYSDFLHDDLWATLDHEQKSYLEGINNAVRHGEEMIEDLLTFSRIGKSDTNPKMINIGELLRNLLAELDLSQGVKVTMADDWPELYSEPTLLRQIFQNLIDNALKFNSNSVKRVTLGWRSGDQNKLELFVKDNGIGIEARFHDHVLKIFERLHTRKEYEGTGIGLAIVKKAAEEMHGAVRVESALGEGSTFFVIIPATGKES